jgi:hypothetical protein
VQHVVAGGPVDLLAVDDVVEPLVAMCVKGEIDLAGGTSTQPGDATRALVR